MSRRLATTSTRIGVPVAGSIVWNTLDEEATAIRRDENAAVRKLGRLLDRLEVESVLVVEEGGEGRRRFVHSGQLETRRCR